MADYVLIESRDPFEYSDTGYFYEVAADLSKAGNNVTFFLVQNGVLTARKGISNSAVDKLQKAAPGVKILADEFSLREHRRFDPNSRVCRLRRARSALAAGRRRSG